MSENQTTGKTRDQLIAVWKQTDPNLTDLEGLGKFVEEQSGPQPPG